MLAGIQCVEAGLGDVKQVDTVAAKCLGLTVGPFTAQNFVGGNPISAHGLDEMNKRLNPWYRTHERLRKLVDANGGLGSPCSWGEGRSSPRKGEANRR